MQQSAAFHQGLHCLYRYKRICCISSGSTLFEMPQSHMHLRTLRMVRKARPQLSVHSVTMRITSAESGTVRFLSTTCRCERLISYTYCYDPLRGRCSPLLKRLWNRRVSLHLSVNVLRLSLWAYSISGESVFRKDCRFK